MTDQQDKWASNILAAINKYGGQCNTDQLYHELPDYRELSFNYEQMLEWLIDLQAVKYLGKDRYWLTLMPEGEKLLKSGLKKHFEKQDTEARLKKGKLIMDVIHSVLTLGSLLCSIISFILGILLSGPIKEILHKLFGLEGT